MANIFESVSRANPRYSAFDLTHDVKLSLDFAELIPVYFQEAVPGDMFRVDAEVMLRMAPMLAPLMHQIHVFVHFFFVPNRLVWNQWEDFITGGREGTTTPNMPTVNLGSVGKGTLRDYIGLPVNSGGANNLTVSELPFRAYQMIWNEYYRDPNLSAELDIDSLSAGDLVELRQRCYEKDYFTSALPWTQRGDEVQIPVEYLDKSNIYDQTDDGTSSLTGGSSLEVGVPNDEIHTAAGEVTRIENVSGIDVNDFRRTMAIQRFLETMARGGYRYTEVLKAHFGIDAGDHRLQRPEYLGGGKQNVAVSEVLSTAETLDSTDTVTNPVGQLHGHGISVGRSNTFQRHFPEHGYVMGIMSVLPRTAYQQGVPKHFLRREKEDFFWPEFANLGEQAVLNKELYWDPDDSAYSEGTFGYQQRYAEYKYIPNRVHGDFTDNLDYWHLGRKFGSQPALNEAFVEMDSAEADRVFAVIGEDHIWAQVLNRVKARRPMPYFADPRL